MGRAGKVLQAFRFTLDPPAGQEEVLLHHAGAARWAFNHALGMKVAAHRQRRTAVEAPVEQGAAEAEARKQVRATVPTKPAIQKHLNSTKGARGPAVCRRALRGRRGHVRGGMR
ncbi:helix-turn-helix domain-containing protein [Streptomyces decoyicus]|uniref:helix-turn-helix domain-containing protein n=1 Tax=Streptomyces decoyicus TaxID=249567 RepID=UPI0036595BE8